MLKSLRLYYHLQLANFKSRTAYPLNFVIGVLGISLIGIVNMLLVWVITQRVPMISGWDFYELLFLVAVWRTADGLFILFFEQIRQIDGLIKAGLFDRFLVRPLNPLFLFSTQKFEIAGFGDVISGVIGLIIACTHLSHWDFIKSVLLVVVILSGCLIEWSIYTIIGTTAFWTLQSTGLKSILSPFLYQFTQYPLSVYSKPIRIILTFLVPVAFMSFYPSYLFFGDAEGIPFNSLLIFLSPLVSVIMVCITYMFWKKGIEAYKGAGS